MRTARGVLLLAVALLVLTACVSTGGGGFATMSSCPSRVGDIPGEPLAHATLTLGSLYAEVRYFGVQPGPDGRCYNAVIGITSDQPQNRSPAQLIFTGRNGRRCNAVLPSAPGGAEREVFIYLTVPKGEQLTQVTLKRGFHQASAKL